MIEPSSHDHHILTISVGAAKNIAQVIEISGIADRNQNVSRPDSQCAAAQLLIAVDQKPVHVFRLDVSFFGNSMLGVTEDAEKENTERDSGYRRLGLGDQIDQRG